MNPLPPYKFTPLFEVILNSYKNKKIIKEEFKKMVDFYKENPLAFYDNLIASKENLESRNELTIPEKKTLDEINKLLNNVLNPESYFIFGDDMLLDDFNKIYNQVKTICSIEDIRNNKPVEVYYYFLDENVSDEERIFPGSKISVNKMTINSLDFLLLYQMFYN